MGQSVVVEPPECFRRLRAAAGVRLTQSRCGAVEPVAPDPGGARLTLGSRYSARFWPAPAMSGRANSWAICFSSRATASVGWRASPGGARELVVNPARLRFAAAAAVLLVVWALPVVTTYLMAPVGARAHDERDLRTTPLVITLR